MEKTDESGIDVATSVTVSASTHFASPALETILKEFSQEAGRASLALNMRQLHLPFEAVIHVAVHAQVVPGETRDQWHLHIRAARNHALYPTFDGILTLTTAGERSCQLQLAGKYVVPFGAVGRAIDVTLLRGAARSSLERFLREVGYRVAVLAHWVDCTR